MQILRRHLVLVIAATVLGLLAGVGYGLLNPPMLTSEALILLPPSNHQTRTQVLIASSDPVLAGALRSVEPGTSVQPLRSRIQVKSLSYNLFSISASGQTEAEAISTANAVAHSYVNYLGSGSLPGGAVYAEVLEPATDTIGGTPLPVYLVLTGGVGALGGALAGAVIALAISRSDRRMRERDEIAESIGVPVVASLPVRHPSDTASWKKLLREYDPEVVDAWHMHKVLHHLGLADGNGSVAVVSLGADRKAVALGPQLAVFAASLGISTLLVISPDQDGNATDNLRAACAAPPEPSERLMHLKLAINDHGKPPRLPDATLTVVVAVVDGKSPDFTEIIRTTAMLMGVSAGAATAEELARVAARAAADGRHLAGILVADPDAADHTTGRLPQLAWPMRLTIPAPKTGMTESSSERQ